MPASLRAGAARVDITPPTGSDLTGYIARQNPSVGVRDPLYVRALVLDDGGRQIAIVTCDLLGFDRELVDEIRDRIAVATTIHAPQVMLACTHTHAGPATIHLADCGEIDPSYVQTLMPRISHTVEMAQANMQPARLAMGSAMSSNGVHNRRTPGDVIDPEIGLLRVDAESDSENAPTETLAVLVNYACHPTTLDGSNRHISAEYPGLVANRIEEETGAIALFLMGAIGDVGPVERGEEVLVSIGNTVADAALAALPTLEANPVEGLEANSNMLALPLLPLPSRADWLKWLSDYEAAALAAEANNKPAEAKIQWAMVHWCERMFEAMQDDLLRPTVNAEVQLMSIGDLMIVGVPGEYFVELGLQIKQGLLQNGAHQVMIAGFANGNVGYIPARRAYPLGGYEIVDAYRYYGYPAAIAPEGGEMIVASAVDMGRKIDD